MYIYIHIYIYIYVEGYGRLCRVLEDGIVIQKPGYSPSMENKSGLYEEVYKVFNVEA